jgi:hypothetical protein
MTVQCVQKIVHREFEKFQKGIRYGNRFKLSNIAKILAKAGRAEKPILNKRRFIIRDRRFHNT